MSPVSVTFVSSHARLGGEENYLAALLEELGPDWVAGVVALEDAPFVERLHAMNVPTEAIPTSAGMPGMLLSALRLRRALRRSSPQVVHANGVKAAVVCAVATFGTRFPLIWLKHDFSWDGWLARAVARQCDQVVGVSEAVTETFRGGTKRKVHVVHNGLPPLAVDREQGRRSLESLLGSPRWRDRLARRPDRPHQGPPRAARRVARPGREQAGSARRVHRRRALPAPRVRPEAQARAGRGRSRRLRQLRRVPRRRRRADAGSDLVVDSLDDRRERAGRKGFPVRRARSDGGGHAVVGYAHGGLPEMLGDCGRLVPPGDRSGLRDAILEC